MANAVKLEEASKANNVLDFTSKFFPKDVQKEFTKYLQNDTNVDELSRRTMQKLRREVTSYSHPRLLRGFGFVNIDHGAITNPEMIPYTVFDKMKNDGQIAIGLAAIKQPIKTIQWRVQCENESQKQFITWAVSKIWKKLIRDMLLAVDYGFVSMEKVFERERVTITGFDPSEQKETTFFDQDAVYIRKIKTQHPTSIKIRVDDKGNFLGIQQRQKQGGSDILVDRPKAFVFTHEEEFGNFYGHSRLRFAYKYWYWGEIVSQFMLRYLERRGTPPTVIEYPVGTSQLDDDTEIENADYALKIGNAIINDAIVTLPSTTDEEGNKEWDIRFIEEQERHQVFIEALTYINVMKLRSLWVPEKTLTQDTQTGSFALVDAHFSLHLLNEEGFVSDIQDKINDEIVAPLTAFNFTPKEAKPCRLALDSLNFSKRTVYRDMMIQVIRGTTNFARAGIIPRQYLDIGEMAKFLELPIADTEDLFVEGTLPIPGTPLYNALIAEKEAKGHSTSSGDESDKNKKKTGKKSTVSNKKEKQIGQPG